MILTLSEMFKHKTQTISWDGASVEAPFNQMDFFFLHPVQHISPKSSLTHLISLKTLKIAQFKKKSSGTSFMEVFLYFPECACILLIKMLSLRKTLS